ncbi:MFS transporter [Deinococcus yavapaiensis]|uniref:DHA1 family tetracycline resistance protein-like MFS transporter n=1 Tax=Deinococcus yavapaiensis KR-236 TaxID=694435 RepID=A0A318SAM3_9DEIO|nr:MFS transporter [Deinococcus yavapaiensis]PYE55458.1 DHA1 family tetracycline resistance protein-like MFS transporter [Deinococcus yavapaiensis KR-236]
MTHPRPPGLPFIFVTLVIDMIGLGVVIPVVPALVAKLADHTVDPARALGWLVASFALAQLLAAPTLGALSDRFGRRPILLVGTLLTAASYALASLAPTLGWLFLARALGGIGGATVGVAHAYVADVSTPATRARNFGLAGAAFGLGLIVGPALGGLLGGRDLHLPFVVSASLALVNFLYGLLVLPESRRAVDAPLDPRAFVPLRALGVLGRFPGLAALAAVCVLAFLSQQFLTSTWVLHGTVRYGWTPEANGLSLTLAGLLGVFVQVALLPRVLERLGNERTLILGIVLGASGSVLYGFAAQGWMLFAVMPLAALGGLGMPPLQALVAGRASPEAQGAVQGALGGLNSLCAIVGPLAATTLFSRFAAPNAALSVPGIAFFITGALLFASLAVYLATARRTTPEPSPA